MSVDITMTATCRPGVVRRTLESFSKFLFRPAGDIQCRLIVNIDPVGPSTQQDVLKVCHEFFPGQLHYNLPDSPSFPKAFIWTWQRALQSDSGCVFHLEDDWELLQPICLTKLFLLLHIYPDLAILRLSAFPSATHVCKNWDKFLYWNGTFFEVPPNLRGLLGFAGHPSLIRKEFVKTILPYLDDGLNPEKQIDGKNKYFGDYLRSCRYGVYIGQDSPALVKDVGRAWMLKLGYRKQGSKAWFMHWEKKE